jgi:molybdopterin-dependent oxidoreductase alpha subunit
MDRMRIAGWAPFGLGHQKPQHQLETLRLIWENRDHLGYAWRVLRHGVCDGCSLTPRGLADDAVPGLHLCLTRLRLLRLNTMPAAPVEVFGDVEKLRALDNRALRKLGRLAYPMIRRPGERGYTRLSWEEALDVVASRLRRTQPERAAFFLTSRGLTNETYYVAQKLARLYGTNHVDNAARLCHAASSVALKSTLGVGASTVSYSDWLKTNLLVLAGTNLANNQPVSMKYLYHAKRNGARIAVVNPYREPGLERYWIPSITKSAIFGTRFLDEFFPVRPGGDVAFFNGVLKVLDERQALDRAFIDSRTNGWAELKAELDRERFPNLEALCGLPRSEMERFASLYAESARAIFIWSMGLTQHPNGVDNVRALINLALARGMVGREGCGLVPIRGHSGVQGGAEVGAVPDFIHEGNAAHYSALWGVPLPDWRGHSCGHMLEAAYNGELDVLYIVGGNFIETMPEPERMDHSLRRLPLRVHQDIVFNTSMLSEPGEEAVVLLPARTRYEQEGGGTQTGTERRIRYTPFIGGRKEGDTVGEARSEWVILRDLGLQLLDGAAREAIHFTSGDAVRADMDRSIPLYRGIVQLKAEGDAMQYGGPRLLEGGICPAFEDQKARFSVTVPPQLRARLLLVTRRGAQFNSILWNDHDPLTGLDRDEILLAPADAKAIGVQAGDRVLLRSPHGEYRARVRTGPVAEGCVQAHWPEVNSLIARHYDPHSGEPDYNADVTIERV